MPLTNPAEQVRMKIKGLREQASDLEAIADELDKLEDGEFIIVVDPDYRLKPASMGHFKGVVSDGYGFHIKLEKFAYIEDINLDGGYELESGEELLERVRKMAPGGWRLVHGRNPAPDELEQDVNHFYPPVYGRPTITKEAGADEVLKKYGFSMKDYKSLFDIA